MISVDSFRHVSDPVRQRSLFKESVTSVEIEIFSFCNRTCTFCPNSVIDRRSANTLMDPALYTRIIQDLAEIDYTGVIWYSRYNEPTADRVFIDRLAEARRALPNARLQTFTNGDYLDAGYIADLRNAGLNELRIMAYLPPGTAQTEPAFRSLMVQRLGKLGLPWQFVNAQTAHVDVAGIDVTYNYGFFLSSGTNRGGVLASGGMRDRQSPCIIPITSVYIDYNGAVVPCCDIRSDVEAHREYVMHRLSPQSSLFEAYANSRLVDWRRGLCSFGPKQTPCDTCNRNQFPATPEMVELFGGVANLAAVAIASEAAPVVRVIDAPKFIGFTMVKNEEDIIEQFMRHNLRFLSKMYVYDDGSTDCTKEIIGRLMGEGLPIIWTNDCIDRLMPGKIGYAQAQIMTLSLHIAATENGAATYFPLDADEFITTDGASNYDLDQDLAGLDSNFYFKVPWRCMVIPSDLEPEFLEDVPKTLRHIEPWSLNGAHFHKIVLRIDDPSIVPRILITQGNHDLLDPSVMREVEFDRLRYVHVPVRSPDQVFRKAVCGWFSIVQRLGKSSENGWHWRNFFERASRGQAVSRRDLQAISEYYAQKDDGVVNLEVVDAHSMFQYDLRYSGLRKNNMEVILRDVENAFEHLHQIRCTNVSF